MKKRIEYLNVKEVSEYLGIPLRTVYHLIKSGKIKSIKMGSTIKCLLADVEKYAEYGTDPSYKQSENDAYHQDRRKYPRINTDLNCRTSIDLKQIKYIKVEGIIRNLSVGGGLIVTQTDKVGRVDPDDPVELQFILPLGDGKARNIIVNGRVLRKTENGVAVKFRQINNNIRSAIKKYVG